MSTSLFAVPFGSTFILSTGKFKVGRIYLLTLIVVIPIHFKGSICLFFINNLAQHYLSFFSILYAHLHVNCITSYINRANTCFLSCYVSSFGLVFRILDSCGQGSAVCTAICIFCFIQKMTQRTYIILCIEI